MNGTKKSIAYEAECKYHIIFAPKFRRKVFFGEKRVEGRKDIKKAV